jgi:hypothetical protein
MKKYDKDYSSPDIMSQETAFKVWLENKREVDKWNAENLSNPEFEYRYSKQMDSFDDLTEEQYYASPMENGGEAIDFTDYGGALAVAPASSAQNELEPGAMLLFRQVGSINDPSNPTNYDLKRKASWADPPCEQIEVDYGPKGTPSGGNKRGKVKEWICDWSDLLPPAEDQGDCGSCYAFGAVNAAEGALAAVTNKLATSLSKMQVLTTPWKTTGPSSYGSCVYKCPANCVSAECPDNCTAVTAECPADCVGKKCPDNCAVSAKCPADCVGANCPATCPAVEECEDRKPCEMKCQASQDCETVQSKCCKPSNNLAAQCAGPPKKDQMPEGNCPTQQQLQVLNEKKDPSRPKWKNVLLEPTTLTWPHQQCNAGIIYDVNSWMTGGGGLCSTDEFPYDILDKKGENVGLGKSFSPRPNTYDNCNCKSQVRFNLPPISFSDSPDPRSPLGTVASEDLLVKVLDFQPVAVGLKCNGIDNYGAGVMGGSGSAGGAFRVQEDAGGHFVLLVGYGTCDTPETTPQCKNKAGKVLKGEQYWKLKNSFGADWGDKGHFLFARGLTELYGPQGTCGMLGALGPPTAPDLNGVAPVA